MRCLALAQAWQSQGGRALFVSHCPNDALRRRVTRYGIGFRSVPASYPDDSDWHLVAKVLIDSPDAWVVVDGYHFDAGYHTLLRESGHRVLVIDDLAQLSFYNADIILNQNLRAEPLHYAAEPHTRCLLGVRYALLRPEFAALTGLERSGAGAGCHLLVTMGGSDIDNVAERVIEALDLLPGAKLGVIVAVGADNPNMATLADAARRSLHNVSVRQNVLDMAALMAWADIAITGAGGTCWELAAMGVPMLTVTLAQNQTIVAEGLSDSRRCSESWVAHDTARPRYRDVARGPDGKFGPASAAR